MQLEETSFGCDLYIGNSEYSSNINLQKLRFLLLILFENKSNMEIYFENNLDFDLAFVFDLILPIDLLAIPLAIFSMNGSERNI